MKKLITLLLAALSLQLNGCARSDHEAEHHHENTEPDKGIHGGRLLSAGSLQIEVTIFEQGVPPEFRVYAYAGDKPLAPQAVALQIELQRMGAAKQLFHFSPQQDYLRGDAQVQEPHSFDVHVTAQYQGREYRWDYAAYEGRTHIDNAVAQASGIEFAVAGPGLLRETVQLYGSIQADPQRVRAVQARFPGVIREVAVASGATVQAGAVLARIESNESLQTYAVTAPISGTLIEHHAQLGEVTGTMPLFVIADFSRVMAQMNVFPRERSRLAVGQALSIQASEGGESQSVRIEFLGVANHTEPGSVARATLENPLIGAGARRWTPGQFITAEATVAQSSLPLTVPLSALQTFRDWQVVFVHEGDTYQAMPLQLGRRDAEQVEVLSGLRAGQRYVSANSYLVKADIEKSGAAHDH